MLLKITFGRCSLLSSILSMTELRIVYVVKQNMFEALALIILVSRFSVVSILFTLLSTGSQQFAHNVKFDGTPRRF